MDVEKIAIQTMFYDYPIKAVVGNLIVRDNGGDGKWYYNTMEETLHDHHTTLNMGEAKAISNLVENSWIGGIKPNNLTTPLDGAFKVLLRCANIFLNEENNNLYASYKHLLRWNGITRLIGEDMMTCMFLAYRHKKELKSYVWEDIQPCDGRLVETLSSEGLCDIHAHLGGAGDPFILNWIGLMNGGFEDDESLEDMGELKVWSVMAARIRYALYSYYLDGNNNAFGEQFSDDMKVLAGLEKGFRSRRWWVKTLVETSVHNARKTNEGLLIDYAIRNDFVDDKLQSPYMLYHGERRLLYLFFCDYQTGNKKVRKIARYVYLYCLIKTAFRKQLVIDHSHRGLYYFKDFNRRKNRFVPDKLKDVAMRFAYQTSIRPGTEDELELRVNATPHEIAVVEGDSLNHSIFGDAEWLDEKQKEKVNYVVHLSKTYQKKKVEEPTRLLVHDLLENHLREKDTTKENKNKKRIKLTGFDAAGEELQCRPAELGHYYRYLCERGHRNFTMHVGEDFYDIADGLRAIDETIVFLGVGKGWRLGHCVAMGIDTYDFYQRKHWVVTMPCQVMLDNMVWTAMTCQDERIAISQALAVRMAKDIKQLMILLFDSNRPSMNTYYHAMWLRSDVAGTIGGGAHPAWERTMKCQDERCVKSREDGNAVKIAYKMQTDAALKTRGNDAVKWKISRDYMLLMTQLQKVMMKRLEKIGVTIESNPTSNLMLSTMERYDELPLFRQNSPSRFWGRHLPVTINTDDKGIFATSLLNEYMLVAKAMSKREGLLTERKWSDKRIEDYLLATISQSRQAKFKWSNNEYEAHRY